VLLAEGERGGLGGERGEWGKGEGAWRNLQWGGVGGDEEEREPAVTVELAMLVIGVVSGGISVT
jgi:hypothetical protein